MTPTENVGDENNAYQQLSPDDILNAVEALGYPCDGRLLALNSYENRVYQVGLEDTSPVVVKFYRPGRWTDDAIREEREFTQKLAELEIPVIEPLKDEAGEVLHRHGPFRLSVYPCRGGRPPDLENPEHLEQMGRFLARIHNLGETSDFKHRPTLDMDSFGTRARAYLLDAGFLPEDLTEAYSTVSQHLLDGIARRLDEVKAARHIRLHGDCHPGNILWRDDGPHIVDFDDARMGPAIQDLWMFLSGDRMQMTVALSDLLEGYTQFRDFDPRELHLMEALRTLRMMHYAAWLARRWQDPAFPRAFPWFNTNRYWEEHILSLKEQMAALDEPALVWN